MTSVLLLTPACARHADVVEPRRVRLRDRIETRVRTHHLDRRLADGVPPERSAALSLRARRLAQPAFAAFLARRVHAGVRSSTEVMRFLTVGVVSPSKCERRLRNLSSQFAGVRTSEMNRV